MKLTGSRSCCGRLEFSRRELRKKNGWIFWMAASPPRGEIPPSFNKKKLFFCWFTRCFWCRVCIMAICCLFFVCLFVCLFDGMMCFMAERVYANAKYRFISLYIMCLHACFKVSAFMNYFYISTFMNWIALIGNYVQHMRFVCVKELYRFVVTQKIVSLCGFRTQTPQLHFSGTTGSDRSRH